MTTEVTPKEEERRLRLAKILEPHLVGAKISSRDFAAMIDINFKYREVELFDGPKDLATLDHMIRAMEQVDPSFWELLSWQAKRQVEMHMSANKYAERIFSGSVEVTGGPGRQKAFNDLLTYRNQLLQSLRYSREYISSSPRKRVSLQKINIERYNLTNISAEYWIEFTNGKFPNREIKETERYSAYLQAVLDFYEVESTAAKAHKSWLSQQRNRPPVWERRFD